MTNEKYDRVESLRALAKNKHEATVLRVNLALEKMMNGNIPISFQSVAKIANVSKTWLYANDDIAYIIRQIRERSSTKKMLDQNTIIERNKKEISILKKRILAMSNENTKLRQQLEIAYAEIYKLNTER